MDEKNDESSKQEVHADTITNFLMNRYNCCANKKSNAKNCDNIQFNAILDIIKEKKWGVPATSLADLQNIHNFSLIFCGRFHH